MRKSLAVSGLMIVLAIAQIVYIGQQNDWNFWASTIIVADWIPLVLIGLAAMATISVSHHLLRAQLNRSAFARELLLVSGYNQEITKGVAARQDATLKTTVLTFIAALCALVCANILGYSAAADKPGTGKAAALVILIFFGMLAALWVHHTHQVRQNGAKLDKESPYPWRFVLFIAITIHAMTCAHFLVAANFIGDNLLTRIAVYFVLWSAMSIEVTFHHRRRKNFGVANNRV